MMKQKESARKWAGMERTTICVEPALYKEFRKYALDNGTTVTALLSQAMRDMVNGSTSTTR